jgi:hypothetical protein
MEINPLAGKLLKLICFFHFVAVIASVLVAPFSSVYSAIMSHIDSSSSVAAYKKTIAPVVGTLVSSTGIFLSSSSLLQLTKPANNITIKPSIEALKVIFL